MHFLIRNLTNISTNSKFREFFSLWVFLLMLLFFEKNSYSTFFHHFFCSDGKIHIFWWENSFSFEIHSVFLTKFTWLRLAKDVSEGVGGLGGWPMDGVVALGDVPGIGAPMGGPEADIVISYLYIFILPVKLIQLWYKTILPPIKKSADALRTRSVLLWSPDCSGQLAMAGSGWVLEFCEMYLVTSSKKKFNFVIKLSRCLSVLDFWNVNLGVYYKLEKKKSILKQTWFFVQFELDFWMLHRQ